MLVFAFSVMSLGGGARAASAQVMASGQTTVAPASISCTTLVYGLYYGSRDMWTNGEVTNLQNFLFAQGYMQVGATGFFGPITMHAVEQFQASQGISAIGIVGPLTRGAVARVSCGGNPPPQSNLSIYSINPSSGPIGTTVSVTGFGFTNDNTIHFGNGVITHVPITSSIAIACTTDPNCHGGINQTLTFTVPSYLNPACYSAGCMMPSWQVVPDAYNVSVENSNDTSNTMTFLVTGGNSQMSPTVYSVSPTSGPIGTAVTVYGSGFNANDIVLIGGGAITSVSIPGSGTQLSFTLPSGVGPYCAPGYMCAMMLRLLTPGQYQISVKDTFTGATSNSVSFTITSGTSDQTPTISGIDAPASLAVGAIGTWTVHASVPFGSTTNLRYSVLWGDENFGMNAPMMQTSTNAPSSVTFTHAYQTIGTHTAVFTVTNDSGQSATTNSTIMVTPFY
ncbi:MAG: hypothetical protein A2675_02135 [Candidatus Yonathbacteria bacterium RIFCSPHIGHO2_01_FULL_51_10]|uniref:PKD domain-containing protein n=1 Tax=Candidatus Yonathbacteria bacterium RIFCSPHIGHO2_01_FULL_51_10 TaxID=1802723 RepID=A0A1G2SA48_9BACT|nr:MAG: hypothetical protein A2675_02135 [Candidatus Yonathbacteria bacterium RIFCSPHIGHO2_01_FULL_51_10]